MRGVARAVMFNNEGQTSKYYVHVVAHHKNEIWLRSRHSQIPMGQKQDEREHQNPHDAQDSHHLRAAHDSCRSPELAAICHLNRETNGANCSVPKQQMSSFFPDEEQKSHYDSRQDTHVIQSNRSDGILPFRNQSMAPPLSKLIAVNLTNKFSQPLQNFSRKIQVYWDRRPQVQQLIWTRTANFYAHIF